jgi:hypothetical protein
MMGRRGARGVLVAKPERKGQFERLTHRWKYHVKMGIQEM